MKQFIAAGKFTLKELKDKLISTTRKYAVGFDNRDINLRYIFKDMVESGRGKNLPYNLIESGSFSWATPQVSCAIPREFNIRTCYQTIRDTTVMLCCYWSLDMPIYLYLFLDRHGNFISFLPCLGNSIMMDPVDNNKFYMPFKARYYALPDWAHNLSFIQDMVEHRESEGKMIAAVNLYVRHIVQTADSDIMAADLRQNLRVFNGKLKPVEEIYPYDKYLDDNLKRYKYDPRDELEKLIKETGVKSTSKKYPILFINDTRVNNNSNNNRVVQPGIYERNIINREEEMDFGMPGMTARIEDNRRLRDYDGDSITQEQLDLLLSGMF